VTGEPSTRGETIVRVLQSSTEAMRVRGVEREESGCERMKEKKRERERNSLSGGQRAHVLIKFSGNLGDSK